MFNYLEWQGNNRYVITERILYSITKKMSIKNQQKINLNPNNHFVIQTANPPHLVVFSHRKSDFYLRVLSKISSQNWRSDLGLICTIRLSKAAGIVSYFEDFVIEDRAKTA
ncbi:MAG: hypothetical protein U9P07_03410 [Pseudomonadota bacterium]|nr:hypothetical protein [Pseudomonadota bacterium]